MKQGQWMLNGSDYERWEASTYFDTKEEAINHGINLLEKYNRNTQDEKTRNHLIDDLALYPDDNKQIYVFYVGQIEKVGFPDLTYRLLENIAEDVCDVAGEYAEDYLDDVTEEHREELQYLIHDWAKRHDYLPSCFLVEGIGEIDIRNLEEVKE
ncbi:TPA: hypothetical protein ACHR9V_002956 [Listeria monocytogenes]|uniref:hypothetical protein n=1 Tax=Listeria seeligeri TaxID=1640 RepID=UPI000FC09B9D|nr:hypothetical protein [Listeria seeligeri]EAC7753521.1 hypothetical protein [Listeria monocytogenes]EAG8533005.1 hypothetical protein [Listeria innocua]EAE7182456.1 hypothetical protein [Listeria monocytogenes]EAE9565586.1 hypothetical protein [Listeria monocytogenes]EAE9799436.1 hypothetical protein [Listeria monocytogenes]